MPIDTKLVLGKAQTFVYDNPFINKVIRNPLLTSLMIVFIIFLAVMLVFRNVDTGEESLLKKSLRVSAYTFLFVTALVFLNNQNIIDDFKKTGKSELMDSLFNGVDDLNKRGGLATDSIVPISGSYEGVNITLPTFGSV